MKEDQKTEQVEFGFRGIQGWEERKGKRIKFFFSRKFPKRFKQL